MSDLSPFPVGEFGDGAWATLAVAHAPSLQGSARRPGPLADLRWKLVRALPGTPACSAHMGY